MPAFLDYLNKINQPQGQMSLPPSAAGIVGIPTDQYIAPFSTVGNAPMSEVSLYGRPPQEMTAAPITEQTTTANPMQVNTMQGISGQGIAGSRQATTPQEAIAGQPTQAGGDIWGVLRDLGQAYSGVGGARVGQAAYSGNLANFREGSGRFAELSSARQQREFENQQKVATAEEQKRQFAQGQQFDLEKLRLQERLRAQGDASQFARQKSLLEYQAQLEGLKPKDFKDTELKAAGFASRMDLAEKNISDATQEFDPTNPATSAGLGTVEALGDIATLGKTNLGETLKGVLSSSDRLKYEQAKGDWITANLRLESGAVISPDEFKRWGKIFFPQVGDDLETIQQKVTARQQASQNLQNQSQGAYDYLKPTQVAQATNAIAPQQARKMEQTTQQYAQQDPRIAQAKAAGYSDAEIQAYLQGR